MVDLILFFWGDCILFSLVAAPICIPTGRAGGFPSPHVLINALYLLSAVLTGVRQDLTAVLIYISLRFSDVEHRFSCFFWHTQVFFERMSTYILCTRLDRVVCSFDVEFGSSVYVLSMNPLSDRFFSPCSRLAFYFVQNLFSLVRFRSLIFARFSCLRRQIQKILLRLMSKRVLCVLTSGGL